MSTKKQSESVGKKSLELQNAVPDSTDAIELEREIHKGSNSDKSYEEEIYETLDRGLKDPKIEGDFYIISVLKKERLLENVLRNYFFYRQSCPTPEYDQTVYKVHRDGIKIEYLWTVPDNATCQWLPIRKNEIPDDQLLLVSMIEAFNRGDLDKLASKLNKEVVK